MTGRLVLTSELETGATSLNVSDFAPGMYFIRVQSEGGGNVVKLIIE
jgi:hypothetical protein